MKPAVGGKSSGSGTPSVKPSAAHKHTWVDVTEQRWAAKNVWVVDQAAWDEVIPGKAYVLCPCGARFGYSREWDAHVEAEDLNGNFDHSYTVLNEPGTTIHHDEVVITRTAGATRRSWSVRSAAIAGGRVDGTLV